MPSGKVVMQIWSAAGAYAGGIEYWIVYLSMIQLSQLWCFGEAVLPSLLVRVASDEEPEEPEERAWFSSMLEAPLLDILSSNTVERGLESTDEEADMVTTDDDDKERWQDRK